MLHPYVIEKHRSLLETELQMELRDYTLQEVEDFSDRLSDAFSLGRGHQLKKQKKQVRAYTEEEQAFVTNELLMSKISYSYWAERYCRINKEGQTVGPLFPLLESQSFLMERMADLELQSYLGERQDGVNVFALKSARQVGISTYAESNIVHRAAMQDNLQCLIAAAVEGEEGSGYLFGMFEKMLSELPLWMRPAVLSYQKDTDIEFDGGTHVWVGSGKTMTGTQGSRGQLGRGKTLPIQHLSELSTWENPDQINGSLWPATPRTWRTFCVYESTAKGRNNWWHRHWKIARKGIGRFVPIFIPWYVEKNKYSLNPPEGWLPKDSTLKHGRKCEETSAFWCGKPYKLTKEQLFWYETTRAEAEESNKLSEFLEEYGSADDEECFQFSGRSIFSTALLQRIEDQAWPLIAAADVAPTRELSS